MSIILGAGLVMLGGTIGAIIMAVVAAGGRDQQREEVRDALAEMANRLDTVRATLIRAAFFAHEDDFGDIEATRVQVHYASLTTAQVIDKLGYLVDLLGYSRSVLDSWKTCDTDGAPVANTGIGGTGSDAPATANTTSGIGVVKAGNYVKQSIASR